MAALAVCVVTVGRIVAVDAAQPVWLGVSSSFAESEQLAHLFSAHSARVRAWLTLHGPLVDPQVSVIIIVISSCAPSRVCCIEACPRASIVSSRRILRRADSLTTPLMLPDNERMPNFCDNCASSIGSNPERGVALSSRVDWALAESVGSIGDCVVACRAVAVWGEKLIFIIR